MFDEERKSALGAESERCGKPKGLAVRRYEAPSAGDGGQQQDRLLKRQWPTDAHPSAMAKREVSTTGEPVDEVAVPSFRAKSERFVEPPRVSVQQPLR